jgi:aspartyl-tRNA(Asn)/glutamyl-tRNA(Gln) amidotransferase subunit A
MPGPASRTKELFREQYELLRRAPEPARETPPCFLARLPQTDGPAGIAEGLPSAAEPGETLSLVEAAKRLRGGTLKAVDLVQTCLGTIRRLDRTLNAFVTVLETEALEEAESLDRRLVREGPVGPLHGIPIAVKDLIHVRGVRTTASSRVLPDSLPDDDAEAVRRLRRAGAIILGKTHTHEFGMGVSTPQSRNPWDPTRLAGGSSGGSAIAVATGMALGSVNTDTRASIRVPSALCGLVGFKGTFGRVSKQGVIPLSWTMDHIGPITRTVADAALLMDAMAGHDPRDPFSIHEPPPDYSSFVGVPLRAPRIGVPASFLARLDPAVALAFRDALDRLRGLGASVVEIEAPGGRMLDMCSAAGLIISRSEAATYHRPWLAARPADYTPDVRDQLEAAQAVLAVDYLQALRFRTEFVATVSGIFGECDLLATPTCPIPAPRAEEAEAVMVLLARNCIPWSFGGFPTLNLPMGLSSAKLPLSLQLIAPHFGEGRLIAVASAYERQTRFSLPDF